MLSVTKQLVCKLEVYNPAKYDSYPEARGPMQLQRLHRLKAGPGYIELIDEIQRAESPKYTFAQAYETGYTFEFGSDAAGIKLYLDHRFELNSAQNAIVEVNRPNFSPEL